MSRSARGRAPPAGTDARLSPARAGGRDGGRGRWEETPAHQEGHALRKEDGGVPQRAWYPMADTDWYTYGRHLTHSV